MNETAPNSEDLDLVPLTDGELELAVSEMQALSLKSLLAANGIDAIIVGANVLPNLPYQIHVPAGVKDEAVRILQEARQAGPSAAEAAEIEGESQGDAPPGE